MKETDWKVYSWYCVNCGQIVHGHKNAQGNITTKCPACKATMIRQIISNKRDRIDVLAPAGETNR